MSRENKLRIEEELRRFEEKGERPMTDSTNQFARSNPPNSDTLTTFRSHVETLMTGGVGKDDAMRNLEIMSGRHNVDFHPLVHDLVEEVYKPGYEVVVTMDDATLTDAIPEDANAPIQVGEQASSESEHQNGGDGGETAETGSGDSDGDTEEGAGEGEDESVESEDGEQVDESGGEEPEVEVPVAKKKAKKS